MITPALVGQLQQGLEQLGEDPQAHPCESYLAYLDLLVEWNRAYNLTGIKDREKMVTHHLLDSLSVLHYIKGDRCLDVGTGPGLPGLILALARPRQSWVLLDSNRKKIRFLNHAVLTLGIKNIEVVNSRLEEYRTQYRFSTIISRAVTSARRFFQVAAGLAAEEGVILAMKGSAPEKEVEALQAAGIPHVVEALNLPGVDVKRHIIIMDSQSRG